MVPLVFLYTTSYYWLIVTVTINGFPFKIFDIKQLAGLDLEMNIVVN